MSMSYRIWLPILLVSLATVAAGAQNPNAQGGGSFMVQCPSTTLLHPTALTAEPAYTGPTKLTVTPKLADGTQLPQLTYVSNGGAIKCQEISGGDGYMTEGDGNQTFLFGFGPLSGLGLIQNGQPGTQFPADFNKPYTDGPNFVNGQTNPDYDPVHPNSNGAITDPAAIMNTGVMNANMPAPLIAIDEDDEFFLTLTNVGMVMRPDLFETHTVHFHGYPNASSFYDGVPDASLAINIGGSFTYYYLAPDAGTYFWHCHITPPEHLQLGMVGQLYVRPRQNRVPNGANLYDSFVNNQQADLRTACNATADILCSTPQPATRGTFTHVTGYKYAYNDGDGSTRYDIDVPIQIHGFDPNFHFVGMTFNPEGFADMKDKYFLLNGRSYPDTVGVIGYAGGPAAGSQTTNADLSTGLNPDPTSRAISTMSSDGFYRHSQPLTTLITLDSRGGPGGTGQRALLRISDLDVTEYQTLASLGIPMQVVGFNAKLLRDQAGNNLYYTTNSITLAGGESLDVILDSTGIPPGTYFLYTPNLDHLSNDAENLGGLMTEVVVN
jgi:Multicopper oxidase